MDKTKIDWIKWQLTDLSQADDIDCDEIDIHGEDAGGRDAICTVKITDIAQQALDLIDHLGG